MTDKKPIITCMECGKVMSSPAQMIAHEGFPCALQQGYRQGFEQGKLAERKEIKKIIDAGLKNRLWACGILQRLKSQLEEVD